MKVRSHSHSFFLLEKMSSDKKSKLDKMLSTDSRSESDFAFVQELMQKSDIKSDIEAYLEKLRAKAEGALLSIDDSADNQSKEYLQELVGFAISRSY